MLVVVFVGVVVGTGLIVRSTARVAIHVIPFDPGRPAADLVLDDSAASGWFQQGLSSPAHGGVAFRTFIGPANRFTVAAFRPPPRFAATSAPPPPDLAWGWIVLRTWAGTDDAGESCVMWLAVRTSDLAAVRAGTDATMAVRLAAKCGSSDT